MSGSDPEADLIKQISLKKFYYHETELNESRCIKIKLKKTMFTQEPQRGKRDFSALLNLSSQIKITDIKVIYSRCCQWMNNTH